MGLQHYHNDVCSYGFAVNIHTSHHAWVVTGIGLDLNSRSAQILVSGLLLCSFEMNHSRHRKGFDDVLYNL